MLRDNISKEGRLYGVLRWTYQPVKAVKNEIRQLRSKLAQRRLVENYLAKPGFHGLQIGCGPVRMPGWINTDFDSDMSADFLVDITKPLPFPDASFEAIYGEEVIEHVGFEEGKRFLSEARRILKPGGAIRLTTPSAEQVCRIYLGLAERSANEWEQFWLNPEQFSPEMWITSMFRFYGHQYIWSTTQLQYEMNVAGFDQTRLCEPHVSGSGIVQLNGLERRYGDAPDWIFLPTMIIEGQKNQAE